MIQKKIKTKIKFLSEKEILLLHPPPCA